MTTTGDTARGEEDRTAGDEPSADSLARLVTLLRRELSDASLTYSEPPLRLTGGFDTLTYRFALSTRREGWAGPLVVRIFRDPEGPLRARYERAVQSAIWAQGFPAPRPVMAYDETDVVGGAFVIMPF